MGPNTNPPSGLFPSGPPRPTYREPHPVRAGGVLAGFGAGCAWLALFALIGGDLRGHLWWLVAAGAVAWLVAMALGRYGDRGAAVGVALATGTGWTATGGAIALSWALAADWPLW